MNRGTWRATVVHRAAESDTRLKQLKTSRGRPAGSSDKGTCRQGDPDSDQQPSFQHPKRRMAVNSCSSGGPPAQGGAAMLLRVRQLKEPCLQKVHLLPWCPDSRRPRERILCAAALSSGRYLWGRRAQERIRAQLEPQEDQRRRRLLVMVSDRLSDKDAQGS